MRYGVILLAMFFMTCIYADEGQEIVVTGSRISRYDYDIMPAVTLAREADYFVQEVRLINDSRSPDLRRTEIINTIDNLLRASKKAGSIKLSYGKGFLVPVNLSDDSLQIIDDRKRADTSYVDIFVKVAMDHGQSSKKQIARLRSFISSAVLAGRTEIEPQGDIGLSIVNPEQYRYEILHKISAENTRIKEAIGGNCEILVAGLEGRVQYERTDIGELTLYISYTTEVSCK